jgi:DNA-binding transcriptional LysR family regulator
MRHLRLLQYVDEVARAGSIRKAAERLNVTASAVNRRIMDLEGELDTELFERRPRGVRLTAAGEMFLRYVRAQSADVERMRSQIEDLKGLRRGVVRVACSQALAPDFLPDQIAEYRARYPQVAFEVSVLDHERAMTALAAYDVDLVIVFRPPYLANFQPLMKLEQRLVVLMTPTHPLASRRAVRLRDCAAHPVALPERSIGGRQLLDEVTARSGLRFNVVAESNSFEFLRGIVLRGGAIRSRFKSERWRAIIEAE